MRGKIKKNALMLPLIASILALTFAISPVLSQGTTLAVSSAIDTNLGPGSSFTVDVTVHDVYGMLGYGFTLYYDTNVLTATNFVSYPPFIMAWPSQIDDSMGLVEMSYSYELPELFGLDVYSEDDPFPVATITFTVDDWGVSALNLENTKISDCNAGLIDHIVVDGCFSNIPETGVYVGLNTGFVENRHFKVSKEPDVFQTLTAQIENMGTATTKAMARFRVLDEMGGIIGTLESGEATITPGQTLRLSADLDTTTLDLPAAYYVEVQVEYVAFTGWMLGRHGGADAAKTTVVLQFKIEA